MADALLTLDRVTKSFGALRVTDTVSLDIPRGELHALIGPNGAGKTSLIHQLSGSLASDSGRVVFDGERSARLPDHRPPPPRPRAKLSDHLDPAALHRARECRARRAIAVGLEPA